MPTTLFNFNTPSDYTLNNVGVSGAVASLVRNSPLFLNKTSNFGTPSDYTYNNTKIVVSAFQAALDTVVNGGNFSQNYASSIGFTFNSSLTEFTGGNLNQVSQIPANETFFAQLATTATANWTTGSSPTGTLSGTTSFSGGKLVLGADGLAVWADPTGLQTGAVRIRYTPGYTGAPADQQSICVIGQTATFPGPGGSTNAIWLTHKTSNVLQITFFNSAGSDVDGAVLTSPSFVAGTEYEIELDFDLTNGATRVFINGTQVGATQTPAFTRTATTSLWIGSSANTQNFSVRNVECFNTVQHTANYSAPSTLPSPTVYAADTISLPPLTFSGGISGITAFTGATVTDTNAPGYVLNGLYWNGSAWVASNNTYAESNIAATVVAHISTLPAASTLQVTLITQSSNTQETASLFLADYNYNLYNQTNPTITLSPGQAISDSDLSAITNITATIVAGGSDAVQFAVSVNGGGSFIYWNGAAWVASTSYAQSSALSTIVSNLGTLPLGTQFILQAYLHSNSGTTTPTLANVVVSYTDMIYGTGTIQSNSTFTAEEISSFLAVFSETGSDTVTFALVVNSALMYWNGSAWAISNGSIAETNTLSVIQANVTTLLTVNSNVGVYAVLNSANGLTTPNITSMTVTYTYGPPQPPGPPTCIVFGFLRDIQSNPVSGATVTFSLVNSVPNAYCEAADNVLLPGSVSATTDSNGFFQQAVLVSAFQGSDTSIVVSIQKGSVAMNVGPTGAPLTLIVPNQASVDITTLLSA